MLQQDKDTECATEMMTFCSDSGLTNHQSRLLSAYSNKMRLSSASMSNLEFQNRLQTLKVHMAQQDGGNHSSNQSEDNEFEQLN